MIDLKFFVVLPTSPEKIIKKCLLFKLRDKYNDLALFFKHLFRERKRNKYVVYIQRNYNKYVQICIKVHTHNVLHLWARPQIVTFNMNSIHLLFLNSVVAVLSFNQV